MPSLTMTLVLLEMATTEVRMMAITLTILNDADDGCAGKSHNYNDDGDGYGRGGSGSGDGSD